jgi:hypothetical protein
MECPDCSQPDRRLFLKTAALGAAVLVAEAANKRTASPETVVSSLYRSLTPEQQKVICFPFGHELQSKVDNNWHITPTKIGQFFNPEQQAMVEEIFRGLHNPEFVDRVMQHMKEDDKSFGNYSVALFGEPGTGKFEFVLTGRHCTARCDGDSVEGAAFGGPIFYGHQAARISPKERTTPVISIGTRASAPTKYSRRSTASSGASLCWAIRERKKRLPPSPSNRKAEISTVSVFRK